MTATSEQLETLRAELEHEEQVAALPRGWTLTRAPERGDVRFVARREGRAGGRSYASAEDFRTLVRRIHERKGETRDVNWLRKPRTKVERYTDV